MSLLTFFESLERLTIAVAIRDSLWLFAVIEAIHLLGLAVIGGAVLIVDLRLMGWGLRQQPVAQVARHARPWLIGSLLVMLASGALLFVSEALKCYGNPAFWFKMASLLLAVGFTFTVRRKVIVSQAAVGPGWSRFAAVVSILLWSGVGIAGRGIGFY